MSLVCKRNEPLIAAMERMRKSGKRIIFCIDDKQRVVGVITDGDIRKSLLEGTALSSPVDTIMNTNFIFAYQDEAREEMFAKLSEKIKTIPVVDREMYLVDYFHFDKATHLPVASPNLRGNEFKYLTEAFLSTWISSSGEYIKKFEENFADYTETKYGIAVTNGTAALHLALLSAGIGPDDEVIVPDLTFAATINAVLYTGATPVIVDVEEKYWTIDPNEIRKAVTPNTKAIIPVHLYGQPCDMDQIITIAKEHDLVVIEDAAQAHGATYDGKKVGGIGDVGCFSFFGNKILTTGEGGMCITNSKKIQETMRILRDHGMSKEKKYWHDVVGFNYRMTNLQAAIGCAQLEKIGQTLSDREKLEKKYQELMKSNSKITFQGIDSTGKRKKVTWLVSIIYHSDKRDDLINKLQKYNIDARPFFYPLSIMPIYKKYLFSNQNSTYLSKHGINLPTQDEITDEQFEIIKKSLYE